MVKANINKSGMKNIEKRIEKDKIKKVKERTKKQLKENKGKPPIVTDLKIKYPKGHHFH